MIVSISHIVVVLVGFAVFLLSAWGIVFPGKLIAMVSGVMDRASGMYAAVGVRIVLGLALIFVAPVSKFPHVFEVLGWIAIAAAIGLPIVGRTRIQRLIAWLTRLPPALIRVWLIFGLLFGGFLVYGVY